MASDFPTQFPSYEPALRHNHDWALTEGRLYFEQRSLVQSTMRDVAGRLIERNVPYAVCGALALFAHGYRRFTENFDVLLTSGGRRKIFTELVDDGYGHPFDGCRFLRSPRTKVRINFWLTGEFPGKGDFAPFILPDLGLRTLVEMKLASGLASLDRMKVDIQELIREAPLTTDLAEKLHPNVADEYLRLCDNLDAPGFRYFRLWPIIRLAQPPRSIEELIAIQPESKELLAAMKSDGVELAPPPHGYHGAALLTRDRFVARRWELHEEREFAESFP